MSSATDGACSPAGQELLKVFADRLQHEHLLITNRITWLMALNGFVVAGVGILVANGNSIDRSSLTQLVVGAATIGALSNASCFFSNYWGSRAIAEAGVALDFALEEIMSSKARAQQQRHMRLYGVDPIRPREPFRFWSPPSKVLHPVICFRSYSLRHLRSHRLASPTAVSPPSSQQRSLQQSSAQS